MVGPDISQWHILIHQLVYRQTERSRRVAGPKSDADNFARGWQFDDDAPRRRPGDYGRAIADPNDIHTAVG